MTTTSGETTSLPATIAYFGETASHLQGSVLPQVDVCDATLRGKNLDSTTLAKLASAREHLSLAASQFLELAGHVEAYHRLMHEAVNATPQAADTDFYRG